MPGIHEQAIGLKNVEEAIAIRDRLLVAFDRAATSAHCPDRVRLLTVTLVGGGFAGVELIGELSSRAASLVKSYAELTADDLQFHLVEAQDPILPEVSARTADWVVKSLRGRGLHVHLSSQITSVTDVHVVLSDGEHFDSPVIVWTAGNAATAVVAHHTDLPVDEKAPSIVRPDLRVGTTESPAPDAWAWDGAGSNRVMSSSKVSPPG